jgi:hypothetical protein
MGMMLVIESEPSLPCPEAFPETDSKEFLRALFGPHVEVLERGLRLDLGPLKHCATDTSEAAEQTLREDWGEEAEEVIAEARQSSELAWHPPSAFVECLEALADSLDRAGRKLPARAYRAVDPSGSYRAYFQSGPFFSDVTGCLAAMRSLQEQGARRARFFAI